MKYKNIILAAMGSIAALAFAGPIFAATSLPDGWYVDGNVGSTRLTGKSYPGSSSSSGVGGGIDIGYKFMPFVGAEFGYTRYATTSIRDSSSTIAGNDKHYSYDVAARGILPIAQTGAELFAKLGVGRNSSSVSISNSSAANQIGLASSSHTKSGLYAAVGADYYFMPELAGVVQWAAAQGNSSTGTMSLVSVGFNFIFG